MTYTLNTKLMPANIVCSVFDLPGGWQGLAPPLDEDDLPSSRRKFWSGVGFSLTENAENVAFFLLLEPLGDPKICLKCVCAHTPPPRHLRRLDPRTFDARQPATPTVFLTNRKLSAVF